MSEKLEKQELIGRINHYIERLVASNRFVDKEKIRIFQEVLELIKVEDGCKVKEQWERN